MNRKIFLEKMLHKYIPKNSNLIVFGGGQMENEILTKNNYKNITFLNIGEQDLKGVNYKIILSPMQNTNLNDKVYDYALVNASIHHSSRPHDCILEMYRIAKKGLLIIEGNDSFLIKVACKFGYSEEFERSAIKNNSGGVDNTNIPNFIYRWTEREIYKLICSFKPNINHKIFFEYENDITNIFKNNNLFKYLINIVLKIYFKLFKKQQNLLGIYVDIENSEKNVF